MNTVWAMVATVAWWPGSDRISARLVVYAPGGELPSQEVRSGESAQGAAVGCVALVRQVLGRDVNVPVLESVTFVEGDGQSVYLLYTTVALPSAMQLDADGNDVDDPSVLGWQDLIGERITGVSKIAVSHIRNYWRQELAETTAVLDFLPKYFTTSQARGIYSSVWRTPQDPGNFHRWLHRQNDGICTQAPAKGDVIAEREEAAAQFIARTANLSISIGRVMAAGMSALKVGPVLAPVAVGAAISAGGVYLAMKQQRGPDPQLYVRANASRVNLVTTYGPRPA